MLCCKTLNLLIAREAGVLSGEELRALRRHLDGCATCRALVRSRDDGLRPKASELQRQQSSVPGANATPLEVYSKVIERVFQGIFEENAEIEDQRTTAPALLTELLNFSQGQRRLLICNSKKYQLWGLAEEALKESRRGWTEDPRRSEDLAFIAVEVTGRMKAPGFRESLLNDLRAEAWSYVANCRRIRTDYDGAQKAFQVAEQMLAQGSGDRLERARLLDLKASFCVDTGSYEIAEKLLAQAIEGYRAVNERHLEGRTLMNRARLLRQRGRVEEAIQVLERAKDLIQIDSEPWLAFALKKNLMVYLTESERADEAQRLLPEVRALAKKHGNRLQRLRLLWTEGLMRKALGQKHLAIEVLEQVREGFISTEIGYDAASASLDLASLYLELGQTEKARQLATESIPLFTSRGVHREALVAWNLFREAAERDALTLGLVQEVASRIRESQSRPAGSGELA